MTVTTTPYVRTNGPAYGSVEYYSEHFSDLLADIGEGDSSRANVLAGLLDALKSWLDFHDKAACQYEAFAVELNALAKELQ
jgi:hypothetical protein